MKPLYVILFFNIILLSGCTTMRVDSYSDSSNDFNKYKTYAWIHRPKNHRLSDTLIKNEIVERELIAYSNQQLEARGLRPDTLNPDILLDYTVKSQRTTEIRPETNYFGMSPFNRYYYNGFNYNMYYNTAPFGFAPGYTYVEVPVTEGSITIYVIDREKNKLEWQATAKGTITSARSFKKDLPKNIKAIFKKYPVRVKKSKSSKNESAALSINSADR